MTALPVCWAGLGQAVGLRKKEPWQTGPAVAAAGWSHGTKSDSAIHAQSSVLLVNEWWLLTHSALMAFTAAF